MTSRISYSKLSRENRKRMLGMTIITVLTFFIKAVFLVMGVNECSSHTEVLRLFQPNMGMASVVIVLAACSAAVSLYYLHSRNLLLCNDKFYCFFYYKRNQKNKQAVLYYQTK